MKTFEAGNKVRWRSSGGVSTGWVKRKVTRPTKVKGHLAKASAKEPQYLVVSKTGAEAIHRPESLELLPDDGLDE